MEKLGIKATFYDFFGYLFPGMFIILFFRIEYVRQEFDKEWSTIFNDMKDLNVYTFLILLGVAYILGHLISTISSLLIEKLLVDKWGISKKSVTIKEIIPDDAYNKLEQKINEKINSVHVEENIRLLICYVESKCSSVYSTAFVFLSFYGMARNLSFIFFGIFLYQQLLIFSTKTFNITSLLFLIFGIVFFNEYTRFRKYFLTHIVNGFIIDE